MLYCRRCGTRIIGGANFCHHCGESVAEEGAEDFAASDTAPAGDLRGEAQDDAGGLGPGSAAASSTSEPFSGEPEEDVWDGGISLKAMAGSFVVTALATVTCLVGSVTAYVRHLEWLCWLLLLAMPLVWLAQSLRVIRRCLSEHYRLTDRRLFLQIGLLRCQKHQIDLAQVEAVRIHQNMLDRLLDVGSIEILTRDRHIGRLLLKGIDDADSVSEKIRSLGRRARDKQAATVERVGGAR